MLGHGNFFPVHITEGLGEFIFFVKPGDCTIWPDQLKRNHCKVIPRKLQPNVPIRELFPKRGSLGSCCWELRLLTPTVTRNAKFPPNTWRHCITTRVCLSSRPTDRQIAVSHRSPHPHPVPSQNSCPNDPAILGALRTQTMLPSYFPNDFAAEMPRVQETYRSDASWEHHRTGCRVSTSRSRDVERCPKGVTLGDLEITWTWSRGDWVHLVRKTPRRRKTTQ